MQALTQLSDAMAEGGSQVVHERAWWSESARRKTDDRVKLLQARNRISNERRQTVQSFLNFVIILAVAAALVWYDMRVFALYAFSVTAGLIIFFSGRLWTLVKVSHATTNAKLLTIADKVGVSDSDFDRVLANEKAERPKWYEDYERDLEKLRGGSDMRVK